MPPEPFQEVVLPASLLRRAPFITASAVSWRQFHEDYGPVVVKVGCVVGGSYLAYRALQLALQWSRMYLKIAGDWLISYFSTRYHHVRRHLFNTRFHYYPAREIEGHSHRSAASVRNGVTYCMENYVHSTGATMYTVSYSDRDRSRGQRLYYQPRDYCLEARNDNIRSTDIIRMVDVDYYVDMPYWLSFGRPMLLYTFIPTTAGGKTMDGSYMFEGDKVHYIVNGGGRYSHQLWDYNHDFVTVDTWTGVYVYSVDHKMTNDPCRRVVQLTPRCFVPFPLSALVVRNPLKRMTVGHNGGWTVITTQDDRGAQWVSIAQSGSTYSVTITRELYDAIKIRYDSSANSRNIADIERLLNKHGHEESHIKAALLFGCLKEVTLPISQPAVTACGYASHYQTIAPLVCEDGRLYARAAGPKFGPEAVFPVVSLNNDKASIDGRVLSVRNSTVPNSIYNMFAREFISCLVPEADVGVGVPWSVSQVYEKQDLPRQRQRTNNVLQWLGHAKMFVRSFMKKEAYNNVTDPRNISTCPTDHVVRLSKFTYPFKEHILKKHKWYVPGLTPGAITDRLMDICAAYDIVYSTDFSRLDGSVSAWMREHLEQAAYLRYFGSDPELVGLLTADSRSKAVTAHDIRYDPGSSRLSGSPLTTDGNTIMCAFIPFAAFRLANYTAEQAIRMTALVCGDDSVVAGILPGQLVQVANALGLKLKLDRVPKGRPVTFLGRTFLDPWTTSSSIQDPRRTLPKIHTTVTNPNEVPAKLAILWKAVGYLVNDPVTPLISSYCQMIIRLHGGGCDDFDLTNVPRACVVDLPWFVRELEMRRNGWSQTSADLDLMYSVIAEILGISDADVRETDARIKSVTNESQWDDAIIPLGLMTHLEPEVKVAAVVNAGTVEATLREPVPTVDVAVGPDVSHLPGSKTKPLRRPGEFRVEAGGEQVFECGPSTCIIRTSNPVPEPRLVVDVGAGGDAKPLSKKQRKRARAREKEQSAERERSPRRLGAADTEAAPPSFTL